LGHGAAGEHHPEAALGQLAAGFQAKAPVRAGDDRKLLANFYHLQVISSMVERTKPSSSPVASCYGS
jgi:hypothetical protein